MRKAINAQQLFQRDCGCCEQLSAGVLSTFGAAGESRRSVPFIVLFEWSAFAGNLGGNAEFLRPIVYARGRGAFLFLKSNSPKIKPYIRRICHAGHQISP